MKKIVTHFNPDLDAICSVWLLKKYAPGFKNAEVVFVSAGETYKNIKVDSREDIVHVDTGLGQFDHHQLKNKTSAAQLVFNWLKNKKKELKKDRALIRLIKVVTAVDHFDEVRWPGSAKDRFNFQVWEMLDGLKQAGKLNDQGLIRTGSKCLEGVYTGLKIKIKAEKEIEEGYQFKTRWGKAIGCLSSNNEVLKLAQKLGYVLAVQKDPETERIRIKARPDSKVDLTETEKKVKKLDPQADWFLHISNKMLLNGSSKSKMKPSRLSLKKVIEIMNLPKG